MHRDRPTDWLTDWSARTFFHCIFYDKNVHNIVHDIITVPAVVYYNNKVFIGRAMHIVVPDPRWPDGRKRFIILFFIILRVYAGQVYIL